MKNYRNLKSLPVITIFEMIFDSSKTISCFFEILASLHQHPDEPKKIIPKKKVEVESSEDDEEDDDEDSEEESDEEDDSD